MEDVLNMGSLPHIKWLLTNETQRKKKTQLKKKCQTVNSRSFMYVCAKNLDFRMSPLWKHTHTYTLKAFLFYNDIYNDPKGRSSAPPEKRDDHSSLSLLKYKLIACKS